MRKRYLVAAFAVLCVAVGLWWDHGGQHWAVVKTGTNCGSSGSPYCYWSGFGSVWPFSLFVFAPAVTAILLIWRTHTCRKHWWCWRKPDHPLEGNEHILLCSRHHPDDQMSVKDAIAHHARLRHRQRPEAPRAGG